MTDTFTQRSTRRCRALSCVLVSYHRHLEGGPHADHMYGLLSQNPFNEKIAFVLRTSHEHMATHCQADTAPLPPPCLCSDDPSLPAPPAQTGAALAACGPSGGAPRVATTAPASARHTTPPMSATTRWVSDVPRCATLPVHVRAVTGLDGRATNSRRSLAGRCCPGNLDWEE